MPTTFAKLTLPLVTLALLAFGCADEGASSSPDDALRSARLDLAGAIAVAQQAEPEGRVVEAEFEQRGDKAIYEVALLVGDEVREVSVDPDRGVVIATEVDPEDLEEARASASALAGAKLSLLDAIARAEREAKGEAFEVEVGEGVIEVMVLLDAGSKIVVIDLAEGSVKAMRDEGEGVEVEGDEEDDDDGGDDD